MIQTMYSRISKFSAAQYFCQKRKKASSGGRSGPKMEMESGRDGWEMRLAVQKNILRRLQILTNGKTPLERDAWWRGMELNLNGNFFCHLSFDNLINLEKVLYQSGLCWIIA